MNEPNWGLFFMEIIKYTAPAIIVFVTIYYLSKQFFKNQEEMSLLADRSKHRDASMTIKLQAFERLMLYCDRIDVINLAMRLTSKDQTAQQMSTGMLVSIQKEYEHNLAQQLYVSDQLWDIISQAKNGTVKLISAAKDTVNDDAPAPELLRAIMAKMEEVQLNPSDQAKRALRSEASLLFNL